MQPVKYNIFIYRHVTVALSLLEGVYPENVPYLYCPVPISVFFLTVYGFEPVIMLNDNY